MKHLKKLTILHSNDLHGDFTAQQVDSQLVGGVSFLSGYLNKVRQQEQNVIYAIAGDMFRGSLIDSEFKGLSTIEIMNMLSPDVVSLGNHEVDYGIAHLLFLEKCAKFPIINCNMYIKSNGVRLFNSHFIKEIDGMRVLFIGVLTEEVLSKTKKEAYIGTLIDIHDAADEIGKICNNYRGEDIDFTVLLTHIGFEADKQLAALLNPAWGVDVIIGGHSHTFLDKPEIVNGIPVVQAGTGTDAIGRFDIVVDTDNNKISSYTWQLVEINGENCPRDTELEQLLSQYQKVTDTKYGRIITRFDKSYTHPRRNTETDIGKLLADATADSLGLDIMLIGSGGIRKDSINSVFTYGDLLEVFPYDDQVIRITIDGQQLKKMLYHIFRKQSYDIPEQVEFYQYSKGLSFISDLTDKCVKDICYNTKPVQDSDIFNVGLEQFHYINMTDFLGLTQADITKHNNPRTVSTSIIQIVDEYFSSGKIKSVNPTPRWVTEE